MDFVVDATTTPEQISNDVSGGQLGKEISRFPPERTITRLRQVGVLMSLEHAESLAQFIMERVKQVRDIEKQTEGKSADVAS